MPAKDRARRYPELLRLARARLRRLGVVPPLDPGALRSALELERGTTISLVETRELPPGSAFGVTGSQADQEVVLYEARTTRSHQQLIVLHEYAHMLLRHPPSELLHTRAEVETFHEIDAAMVSEVLGVSPYSDSAATSVPPRRTRPERRWLPPALRRAPASEMLPVSPEASLYARVAEQEAETLATILLGWVPGQAGYIPARPDGRLGAILGDEGAW